MFLQILASFVTFMALSAAQAKPAQIWNLNDVSYLYPIPKTSLETSDFLLKPTDQRQQGQLLPQNLFNMVPTLNNGGSGQLNVYEHELKVVGVRIDPCPNTDIPSECSPEVRLVWQLVAVDEDSKLWTTQDATVHTFYKIELQAFEVLKTELLKLKSENTAENVDTNFQPLGVHPAFLNPSTRQHFVEKLNTLITTNCGENNLYKITFMRLLTPNIWWRFGGVLKTQSKWNPIIIPRLTINFQDIFNSAPETASGTNFPGKEMDAIFNILPATYPQDDDLTTVINRGFRENDDKDITEFKRKISATDRFQNPKLTNPTTLDCASCHFADSTRFYMNSRFPELGPFKSTFAFQNPNPSIFNLENSTIVPRATRAIRAFGYFGDQPAINQRAIHDSAESAQWLNR